MLLLRKFSSSSSSSTTSVIDVRAFLQVSSSVNVKRHLLPRFGSTMVTFGASNNIGVNSGTLFSLYEL